MGTINLCIRHYDEMTGRKGFPVIIVTGISGAGKSTALKVFEDMGFFTVDGLPLPMVGKLVHLFTSENPRNYRGLAVGVDIRQRDFLKEWEGIKKLVEEIAELAIIFLEASLEVLLKRYATTRRPHPLESQNLTLEHALEEEKRLLSPIREEAHFIIDTSSFSIHDLRRSIQGKFNFLTDKKKGMRIYLISFGFKYGVPKEADILLDLRFLPNPYFEQTLKERDGRENQIQQWIMDFSQSKAFMDKLMDFLNFLIPLYAEEGRYRLTLAFGCTGGYHRSVAIAEMVYNKLKKGNFNVYLEHRHLSLGLGYGRDYNRNPS